MKKSENVIVSDEAGTALIVRSRANGDVRCQIDSADMCTVLQHQWHAARTVGGQIYVRTKVGGRLLYLHQHIAGIDSAGAVVDHINRDTLDCRRANLRHCSATANGRNRVGRGVEQRAAGRWRAHVRHAGRLRHLGVYATEGEARAAYRAAKIALGHVTPGTV